MPITLQYPSVTSYRIEVSGWDNDDHFFVESTDLEWGEEAGKRINTSHDLRDGAVIFVRLLQNPIPGTNYPIAYRVERMESRGRPERNEFRLIQLRPRR